MLLKCSRGSTSIFGDIKGVHIIFDDMIVASENANEHDRIPAEVFKRALENSVRFNIDKMQLCLMRGSHYLTARHESGSRKSQSNH